MKAANFSKLLTAMISAGTMFACQPKSETINNYFDSGKVTQQNEELVEGTINGGGGKGIRCVDPVTGIFKLQLLDLYEAKVLYGLESLQPPENQEMAFELLAEKIAAHMWNPSTIDFEEYKKLLVEGLKHFFTKEVRFIQKGKKLKPINDAFEPLVDSNCQIVQIAVYYDESIILVDQELWNELNWLDRVALYAHEYFYKIDRSNGNTNSIAARKLVGQLFSTNGARPRSDGVPYETNLHSTCHLINKHEVSVGYGYMWQSEKVSFGRKRTGVEIVFNFLENITPIFRTSVFLDYISFDKVFLPDFSSRDLSNLTVDSYYDEASKFKTLYFEFQGNGSGFVVIRDDRTGLFSEEYKLSCSEPYPENKPN